MEKLITVTEAAELLGLNVESVYRRCRLKEIPCYKIGRTYRFKESKLLLWLESKEQMKRMK